MCKFEPSQKDESKWQSTDSSKAYRNTSAFKWILTRYQFTVDTWKYTTVHRVEDRVCS